MGWFDGEPIEDLVIYQLSNFHCSTLTRDELGKLVADFNKKFTFWNLLVRTHIPNQERGSYALYVVKGVSCFSKEQDGKILKEELDNMQAYVRGYEMAVRSFAGERGLW